jgi:hypothetical protein
MSQEIAISTLVYNALIKKYEAQRAQALAELSVYLTNPVGIGEHPQIIEEACRIAENLATAEDVIGTLQRNFQRAPEMPLNEGNSEE